MRASVTRPVRKSQEAQNCAGDYVNTNARKYVQTPVSFELPIFNASFPLFAPSDFIGVETRPSLVPQFLMRLRLLRPELDATALDDPARAGLALVCRHRGAAAGEVAPGDAARHRLGRREVVEGDSYLTTF